MGLFLSGAGGQDEQLSDDSATLMSYGIQENDTIKLQELAGGGGGT